MSSAPVVADQINQNVQFAEIVPEKSNVIDWAATMFDGNYEETVRSYLQRPVPIGNFVWDENAARDDVIFEASNLVNVWLASMPFILRKLQGFKYLRGDLEVQVRVNGNRFQYGQAIVAFQPLAGDKRFGISWERRDSIYSDVLCPSVEISPFMDNVATLCIPFAYPEYYLNLTSASYYENTDDGPSADNLGRLKISVLNPLQTVNEVVSSVSATVYCRMVNPVVTGFTNFEAGSRTVPSSALEEQSGLVSSVKRFLRSDDNASIPIVRAGNATVKVSPAGLDLCRADGADTSAQGGFHGNNSTDGVFDQVGHGEDMQFQKIFSKANLMRTVDWSASDATNTSLTAWRVTPHQTGFQLRGGEKQAQSISLNGARTYLTHLADSFAYWRGALRYRIQVVASGFHSGRLMVSWCPEWYDNELGSDYTAPTIASVHQRYTVVLDLQQESDLFIEVPYVQSRPWLPTAALSPQVVQLPNYNGYVQIGVLNPLASSGEVVSSVQINIWQYGSSTLEFAMPVGRTPPSLFANALDSAVLAIPQLYDNYGTAPIGSVLALPPDELEEQCLDLPINDTKAKPLVAAHPPMPRIAMGERITSVLDLVRRPSPARMQWRATGTIFNGLFTRDQDSSLSAASRAVYCGNFVRYFQDMYLGNRGSIRYALFAPLSLYARLAMVRGSTSFLPTSTAYGAYVGEVAQVNNSAHAVELTVPYYAPYLFIPTKSMKGLGNAVAGSSVAALPDQWGVLTVDSRITGVDNRVLFISGGTDYELQYLIPPQPVGTQGVAAGLAATTNVTSYNVGTIPRSSADPVGVSPQDKVRENVVTAG